MFDEYIKYATTKCRLPIELRTNKDLASKFIRFLSANEIPILNSDIFVLASWVGENLYQYKCDKKHTRIKKIELLKEEYVADFSVPEGNSYTANGIIVHNCNLPKDVSKEVVSDIYMRAWTAGCKGFTVYRDGCRTGILVSESSKKEKDKNGRPVGITYIPAPKRPLELQCHIKKSKVQGEAWTIFVGLLNGLPYEVFGGLSKYIDIPNKYKEGKIVKNGRNSDGVTAYNLIVGEGDDQMVIKDIANVFENKNYGAFTRTISLAIRHGTPIQFVVEQLVKDKFSDMTSFSKVIARVLKSYIKDGTSSGEKVCSSCNSSGTLVYYEGCILCSSCGNSKCG